MLVGETEGLSLSFIGEKSGLTLLWKYSSLLFIFSILISSCSEPIFFLSASIKSLLSDSLYLKKLVSFFLFNFLLLAFSKEIEPERPDLFRERETEGAWTLESFDSDFIIVDGLEDLVFVEKAYLRLILEPSTELLSS